MYWLMREVVVVVLSRVFSFLIDNGLDLERRVTRRILLTSSSCAAIYGVTDLTMRRYKGWYFTSCFVVYSGKGQQLVKTRRYEYIELSPHTSNIFS